jgi:putative ABC transport system permease protein
MIELTIPALLAAFFATLIIVSFASRRRVLAKLAMRNVSRRKSYSAIVIAGLMIATAMISTSLVMGDTLDSIISQSYFDESGNVDIVVSVPDDSGLYTYFNQTVFYNNLTYARYSGLLPDVDAAAPAIRERVAMLDLASSRPVPRATLFGYDPLHVVNLLVNEGGDSVAPSQVSDGSVVVNRRLADEMEAHIGDRVVLMTEFGQPAGFSISGIANNDGMGAWTGASLVFMDLVSAQDLLGRHDMINIIDVSNKGGVDKGYLISDIVITELEEAMPASLRFDFQPIKVEGMAFAESSSDQISNIFLVMSSFAIIAGMALITNIFVVLSEERKSEMGMGRAIGMQRSQLTLTFTFEGVVYAVLASVVGAFAGLLIAYVMVNAFGAVFTNSTTSFEIHFQWSSLILAACAGFLITTVTVVIAAWRVSKLNIVRAIGDIPEPLVARSYRFYWVLAVAGIAGGILCAIAGEAYGQLAGVIAGPCMIAIGFAMAITRYVKPKIPFTIAGLFVILWTLDPLDIIGALFGDLDMSVEMFTISGILLVSGGVLVTIFNSDALLKALVTVFGRGRNAIPVFKAAISYPMNKKFRTGLTIFMFALIMFTVVVMSMVASFERESVAETTLHYSGGFDIIGYSIKDVPQDGISAGLQHIEEKNPGAVDRIEAARTSYVTVRPPGSVETVGYQMIGFNSTMLESNRFALIDRSDSFSSDQEAWRALEGVDSPYAIVDGSVAPYIYGPSFGVFSVRVGDQIQTEVYTGAQRNFTVIGIMEQRLITGIYTSFDIVNDFCPISYSNLFYFGTSPESGISQENIGDMIEVEFIQYGMKTYVVENSVSEFLGMVSSILQLSEIYLGIGQIVGIAGMGIVTIRNVSERRQEIGVMRAIGYQRDMILKTFLLEASFVSLLGIALGVVLGLGLSHTLYIWGGFSTSAPFVIPWIEILAVVGVAFLFTLASTLPPARRASQLTPAEALRRIG